MGRTAVTVAFAAGLSVLAAPPNPLSAQPTVNWSGYAISFPLYQETEPTVARFTHDVVRRFANSSRIRLRPSLDLDDGSFVRLEWEAAATYTSAGLSGAPRLDVPGQVISMAWNPVQGSRWSVVHVVDRLFFRTTKGPVEWTVGRQRIAWGSGRMWNPTDLFNPLNPSVVVKTEKDGVDAVVSKVIIGNFTDATLVWNPRKGLPSNYGLRLRTNVAGFDLAGVAGRFDRRWSVGADVAGSVLDAGVRTEALISGVDLDPDRRYVRLTAGVDNQFTERLYTMAEYHFNGRGASNRFQYDLLALARGEVINVGREFGTVQASYLVHPLVSVSAQLLRSFTDQSGCAGLTVSYNAGEESTIAVGGQYFFGDPLTEYRYYPRLVYARLETYF